MSANLSDGRVLIVDDEPNARAGIRIVLEGVPAVGEIHECGCGEDAVAAIRETSPSLLFLDVQMPDMDGFEVLDRIADQPLPRIVFVTAFEEHALRAFEAEAVDYVLKPFSDSRLIAATQRALRREAVDSVGPLLRWASALPLLERSGDAAADDPRGSVDAGAKRFVVRTRRRIYFVPMAQVDWIRAEGNYVALVVGTKEHLIRTSLTGLEALLNPSWFCRIHRSTIVNLDRVLELRPEPSGDCVVIMKDERRLRLSRRYRDRLGDLLI